MIRVIDAAPRSATPPSVTCSTRRSCAARLQLNAAAASHIPIAIAPRHQAGLGGASAARSPRNTATTSKCPTARRNPSTKPRAGSEPFVKWSTSTRRFPGSCTAWSSSTGLQSTTPITAATTARRQLTTATNTRAALETPNGERGVGDVPLGAIARRSDQGNHHPGVAAEDGPGGEEHDHPARARAGAGSTGGSARPGRTCGRRRPCRCRSPTHPTTFPAGTRSTVPLRWRRTGSGRCRPPATNESDRAGDTPARAGRS